jgi:outer membrane protein assembly factor BamB
VDSSSSGSLPFASAWSSQSLGGSIYAEPLVYKGLVLVATESNDVYAFNESTGQVLWHANACAGGSSPCAPVPASEIQALVGCGNISPTVGITSTPVIDSATNRVFVVADTWDGTNASSIQHRLVGFNLADGSLVSGLPLAVDPPGAGPAALLQRTALALDAGKVIVGYGGNYGDCGSYHGWLVAAPETGGSLQTFEVAPNTSGGAIWGSGDGPAVDSSGNIWATSGNGFGSSYDYQESVLKLNSNLTLLDHWAPSNWQFLDTSDSDLGSSDPLLLPSGLVFQIGKQGTGYLLSASSLGGTGAAPVYQAQVCGQTADASFGGGVYYSGVIYVSCADGLRALSLNTSTRTFSAQSGWQVPSAAIGPPIVAGGLVWVTAWDAATLYGLNPQTGQAVVTQTTPPMMHFATPAASDGKLFLATGQTVEAYTIASPTTGTAPVVSGISPSSGPAAGGTSVTITGTNLSGATAVKFGSTLAGAFTVVSATQVTATAPAGTGTVDVTVSTSGGTSATGANDKYTYVPAAANLLQNPSLESASSGVPTCWVLGGYGTNTYTWTRTTDAHSGSYAESLALTSLTSGDRKLLSAEDAGTCAPAATPGATYTVGAWYKVPSGSTGTPRFFAYYRTSSGVWTFWRTSPTFATNSSWTYATWTTPPFPSGATNIAVGMGLTTTGAVTMDDFSLAATKLL